MFNSTNCTLAETLKFILTFFPLQANVDYNSNIQVKNEYCNEYSKTVSNATCFDFIIIGAGSAGCVVANRLSEVAHWNILLLEAGIEEPPFTKIPAVTPFLFNKIYDWGYVSESDNFTCKSFKNGKCFQPHGKMLGGSSGINYMHYLRGFKNDYDAWSNMGNEEWSYDDVLKYFKKPEDNLNDDIYKNYKKYHGRGGYQTVMRFPYTDKNLRTIIDAWKELGLLEVNQNVENNYGVMHSQATSRHGERVSTNKAFLKSIRKERRNLTILPKSYVTKILIEKNDKDQLVAYGVEYFRDNKSNIALARKEVISSAGAFNSPKLLMLSGIGPADHLKALNLSVHEDLLSVGQNLIDHVVFGNIIFKLNGTGVLYSCDQKKNMINEYAESRTGPLSSTGLVEITSYFHTDSSLKKNIVPNVGAGIGPFPSPVIEDGVINPFRNSMGMLNEYEAISVGVALLYPNSKGYILLNEKDPSRKQPIIRMNYYSDKTDLQIIIAAAQIIANNFGKTKSMRKLGAKLIEAPFKQCQDHKFASNAYWACIALEFTSTNAHQAGTCKMGPKWDASAVVDPRLKVKGVTNLRVVDCSIIPRMVGGHLNAVAIMIGEKASDMIKEDWGVLNTY